MLNISNMAEREIKRVITIEGSESLNTLNSLNTRIKELRGSMQDLDIVSEEYREVSQEVTKLENVKRNAMRGVTAAVEGSYNAYSKELSILQQHRKTLHEDSEEYKQITKRVGELQEKLKSMDAEVGMFQRNVGNYASAFDGLQGSVNGVVAQLPSLNSGIAGFAQGLNGSLPQLVKSIQAYKEMAAEAGESVSTIKALGKALLSWNTVISIAVALIVKYSEQITAWVKNLGNAEKQLTITQKAQKALNEEIKESGLSIGDEIYKLKELQNAWIELGDSLDARKRFIEDNKSAFDELGVSVQNVADADRLFIDQTDAYILALKARAQAAAAQKLAEEEYEKAIVASLEVEREKEKLDGIPKEKLTTWVDYEGRVHESYGSNQAYIGQREVYEKALAKEKELLNMADALFNMSTDFSAEAERLLKEAGFTTPTPPTPTNNPSSSTNKKPSVTFGVGSRKTNMMSKGALASYTSVFDDTASNERTKAMLEAKNKMIGASAEERLQIEEALATKLAMIEELRLQEHEIVLSSQLASEELTAEQRYEIEKALTENKLAQAELQLANEEARAKREKEIRDKSLAEEKQRQSQIEKIHSQSIASTSKLLSSIADLGEEDAKWQKGLRKASIVMDTYTAAMSGWKTAQTLPAPMNTIVGSANVAASIAMGAKQLQALNKTAIDGSNASLSGAVSAPVVASSTPASLVRNLQGDNELSELNKETKVYVVESDITNAQNVAKTRVQSATF